MAVAKYSYPKARRDDVVDNYHGTMVADPYRWLEDAQSQETQEFVKAQTELFNQFMEQIPQRHAIKDRLRELFDFQKFGVPKTRGDRLFFMKNDGLQNQPVLYVQDGTDDQPRPLLDPNALSEDGTVAIISYYPNEDGTLLAYNTAASGSDWQEIHVLDVETGDVLPDTIQWCKFAFVAWKEDSSGFYYNRFPEPGTVPPEDQAKCGKVFWHQLGTPQDEDILIYERPDFKELMFMPFISEDHQYLMLHVVHGSASQNRFYYRPLESDGDFVRLLDDADGKYLFINNIGSTFYFHTDIDAPQGRIIAIDVEHPERGNWKEIIPERAETLASAVMAKDRFVLAYMKNAHHHLGMYDLDGNLVQDIKMAEMGTVFEMRGKQKSSDVYFGFDTFLKPMRIQKLNVDSNELTTLFEPEVNFNAEDYEVKQVRYPSKDGTQISMFLIHKKGVELDGTNPTLLYGYGGFNISMTPMFAPMRMLWAEQGGVYAVANLRGGSEYGEAWHKAGMLDKKQNVFDDFIAAGEWLIGQGYTSSQKLSIYGGSNGGLLTSACMIQRPDLFGAVLCGVPVTDMLRFHKFTVGRFWINEFGNAEENPEHFEFMYKYSPLHNVKEGETYPPILIFTADTDDRVVPAHPFKFTATMQAADAGENPILLRVETKAGHGLGKPISKMIHEQSEFVSFLLKSLNCF